MAKILIFDYPNPSELSGNSSGAITSRHDRYRRPSETAAVARGGREASYRKPGTGKLAKPHMHTPITANLVYDAGGDDVSARLSGGFCCISMLIRLKNLWSRLTL